MKAIIIRNATIPQRRPITGCCIPSDMAHVSLHGVSIQKTAGEKPKDGAGRGENRSIRLHDYSRNVNVAAAKMRLEEEIGTKQRNSHKRVESNSPGGRAEKNPLPPGEGCRNAAG
ncbi:MAG: hypothetical protein WD065_20230 [Planctomycetaceae bacterium]